MDAAMNLGLGLSLIHILERVGALARKHGFEPRMWSDRYFRCASPNDDYYEDDIESRCV